MSKNKKNIVVFLVSIVLLFIVVISTLIILVIRGDLPTSDDSKSIKFSDDVRKTVSISLGSVVPEVIDKQLKIINNPVGSEIEKYNALRNLSFYFSAEYSRNHNPKIKEYNDTVINDFAKENFKKLYKKEHFMILCSDPTCGQKINPELIEVIRIAKESKIPDYMKVTIDSNLTAAGQAPDKDIDNKRIGFTIVYHQLIRYGDPIASNGATLLKKYAKDKYNIDLR